MLFKAVSLNLINCNFILPSSKIKCINHIKLSAKNEENKLFLIAYVHYLYVLEFKKILQRIKLFTFRLGQGEC